MENKILVGSLCLTDIVEKAKAGHSSFTKAKNGKIYFNILQWINDEADQYNNNSSYQLNSAKEKRDEEGKCYIGNAKWMARPQITEEDTKDLNLGGVIAAEKVTTPVDDEPTDDLPF